MSAGPVSEGGLGGAERARSLARGRSLGQWVEARRGPRAEVDPWKANHALWEEEPDGRGGKLPIATLFLAASECAWKCSMCDLWRHTLPAKTPEGAIPRQIERALRELPPARRIKLYNSGSFFDPRSIPPKDHGPIAALCAGFERMVVECHPALAGERVDRFRRVWRRELEVAMGLETVHPEALRFLNKGITAEGFAAATRSLRERGCFVRAFALVKPPLLSEREGVEWACRSVEFAFEAGVSTVSLIPTRGGNGAMEELAGEGLFSPPRLASLEAAMEHALGLNAGVALADLWDLAQFSNCPVCFEARQARLQRMNLSQAAEPRVACGACGGD